MIFISFWFFIFLNLLHSVPAQPQQLNVPAGSRCTQKDGSLGACQLFKTCKWVKEKKINLRSLVTCSFVGRDPIICCNDVVPPQRPKTTTSKADNGSITFYEPEDDNETTPNKTPVKVPLIDKLTERKSDIACKLINALSASINLGLTPHIINGFPAEAGEFPHMAAIGYKNKLNEVSYDCGGSLISSTWILTAAHCVNKRDRVPSSVRMGKVTLLSADDELEEQDVDIKQIFIHPKYTSRKKYNDIALIELVKAVVYSFTVNPACLYSKPDDITEKLIVCGWGVMNTKTKSKSPDLLKASLDFMTITECNKQFQSFSWFAEELPEGLGASQVCAIDTVNRADTCQGDSGGPIQITQIIGADKRNIIVGLTSFGVHCGSQLPSVYTRVSEFLDWIEDKVWPGEVKIN